ncbi:hypothetical protein T4A_928, partial [Trichinella pseudospiralis]
LVYTGAILVPLLQSQQRANCITRSPTSHSKQQDSED